MQYNRYKNNNSLGIVKWISEIVFLTLFGMFLCRRLLGETLWIYKYSAVGSFWKFSIYFFDEWLVYLLLVFIIARMIILYDKIYENIFILVSIAIAKISQLSSEDNYILVIILFIIAARGINAKKILCFSAIFNILVCIVTVTGSLVGIIDNYIQLGRDREYLGFTWTTTSVMLFSYFVFVYIVIKSGKLNILEFLIITMINIWFYCRTNTRFAFLIVFVTVAMFFVFQHFYQVRIWLNNYKVFFVILPWLFFAFIFTISICYSDKNYMLVKLNGLLSNRLQQCKLAFSQYGISAFGRPVTWVLSDQTTEKVPANYVDTAYLQVLIYYGVAAVMILLIFSSILIYRAFESKKYSLAVCFVFILLFGLTERQLFWIEFDSLLILSLSDMRGLDLNKKNRLINYRKCEDVL